jgi:hypothetical protein
MKMLPRLNALIDRLDDLDLDSGEVLDLLDLLALCVNQLRSPFTL